jgi:biopolymer transport protein ExbD
MNFERNAHAEDEELEINLTPLIDVVFLLLIFFMVSTSFVETRGLKVDLPGSSSGEVARSSKPAEITLTESGVLQLNGKTLEMEDLEGGLKSFLEQGGEQSLVLKADQKTNHGQVVKILDLANRAGIGKIAIAAVPLEKGKRKK